VEPPKNYKDSLLRFLDQSPTAFHCTENLAKDFLQAGFSQLKENDQWELKPHGRYFVIRGEASLVAWIMGKESPGETGFRIAAAHTDSPLLKVKNLSQKLWKGSLIQGIEIYGSPILSTWLDKDLALAGRLVVQIGEEHRHVLYHSSRPLGIIPNLAIHLNRDINKGVELNPQKDLQVLTFLTKGISSLEEEMTLSLPSGAKILDADLFFIPWEKAQAYEDQWQSITSGRLDNLLGSHSLAQSLISTKPGTGTQLGAFFDHEEIGSQSAHGAGSSFLEDILFRLSSSVSTEDYFRAKAKSNLLSIDGAHALHPSHEDKMDSAYTPVLGQGPVIKSNSLQKYATNAATSAWFIRLCEKTKIPFQKIVNRSDLPTGSTIGPILSTKLGIPALDIGSALLAMHSSRETASFLDHQHMINILTAYFQEENL